MDNSHVRAGRTTSAVQPRATAWRRGLVVVAATALAAVPMTGMAAARSHRTDTGTHRSPAAAALPTAVGTWSVRATGDDGNVINTVMTLASDGTLGNNVGGKGTWAATGRNTFAFHLSERLYDEHKNLVRRIEISQKAKLCGAGKTFTGSGTALTYDAKGALQATNQLRTEATRN
ncbi:hypothetical protein [Streptomyces sp. YGL11-2]|uniref:hypothetical protein n=1 Tax=Streptomyces sp. YGL11-2 TaxID=3414028 RepID=UPI003CEF94D6